MLLRRSNVRETNSTLVPRTSRNVIEKTCRPPPCTGVRASPRFSDLLLFSDIYLYLGCTRFPYLSRIFNSHLSATFLLIRLEKVSLSRNPSVEIVFFFPSLSLFLFLFFFISAHSSSRNRSLFFFFLSLAFSRLLHVALYFSRRRGRRKEEKEKERAKRSDIREAIRTTHRCGGRRRQRRLDAVCLNTAEFGTCWNGEEIFSGAFQP